MATATGTRQPGSSTPGKPAWLTVLDGLCGPCADAEFYGLRKKHGQCEHGGCRCAFTVPEVWPAGTWPVP